jgi:hypothetical protein
MEEVKIFWNDLSEEGKETLINAGFEPNEAHKTEIASVGILRIH